MRDGLVMFGNPGNWEWVEDRLWIRVCIPCRVVYAPNLAATVCPRHGHTHAISTRRIHWGVRGVDGPQYGPVQRPSRKASAHILWIALGA